MAQIIKIKRSPSSGSASPSSLSQGELAYSANSNKLFIGNPGTGDVTVIGGKLYIDMLDHLAGVLNPNSAIIVDSNKKIDQLNVDNITIDGNAITSTDANGNINIAPNGAGNIILDGQNWPQAPGTDGYFLTTASSGQLSWAAIPSGSFTITDGTNNDTFTTGNTLTFEGGTNIATTVTDDNIKFDYDGPLPAIKLDVNGDPILESTVTAAEVRTLLNVDSAGTDNSTDVTIAAGSKDYASIDFNAQELTFHAIDLTPTTGDVTGVLGVGNGGTGLSTIAADNILYSSSNNTLEAAPISAFGRSLIDDADASAARATLLVDPAGTDNSTDVTLDTQNHDYLSIAGQEITLGAIDLDADVTGVLPNARLENSSITIGTTSIDLGGTSTSLEGLNAVYTDSLIVNNITIDNNTISATDENGDVVLAPNGTGTVDVSSARVTGVADPVNANDAANKAYVDSVAEGLHVHEQVHALTTTSLATITGDSVTYNNGTDGVGATLTLGTALDLAGGDIDGDTDISVGDRIIIAGETNAVHNGIYVITSSTVLTRAADFDTPAEMAGGDFVFVTHGTTYADTGWVLSEPVTAVGTDAVTFIQFSGAGAYEAGNGLSRNGTVFSVNVGSGIALSNDAIVLNSTAGGAGLTYTDGVLAVGGTANRISVSADAIDIASNYVGQASINTLGTITTGTWNATTIGTTKGGTGLTSYATGDLLYASGLNTLSKLTKPTVDNSILTMSAAGVPAWTNIIDGGEFSA